MSIHWKEPQLAFIRHLGNKHFTRATSCRPLTMCTTSRNKFYYPPHYAIPVLHLIYFALSVVSRSCFSVVTGASPKRWTKVLNRYLDFLHLLPNILTTLL